MVAWLPTATFLDASFYCRLSSPNVCRAWRCEDRAEFASGDENPTGRRQGASPGGRLVRPRAAGRRYEQALGPAAWTAGGTRRLRQDDVSRQVCVECRSSGRLVPVRVVGWLERPAAAPPGRGIRARNR